MPRNSAAGIWTIFGTAPSYGSEGDWVRGHLVTATWAELEAVDGTIDLSTLQSRVNNILGKGRRFAVMVYHGDDSPSWIFNYVDETVTTADSYPDYLDEAYLPRLQLLTEAVAAYLDGLDADDRAQLDYVQCPAGKSGDEQAYAGTWQSGPDYVVGSAEWTQWTKDVFTMYKEAYDGTNIPLLFNWGDGGEAWNWVSGWDTDLARFQWIENLYGGDHSKFMLKYGMTGHRADAPRSVQVIEYKNRLLRPLAIGNREEFDSATVGIFSVAAEYLTNFYWTMLACLHEHMHQWNIKWGDFSSQQRSDYTFIFEFFNKYAGFEANDAPGAWIALRDILDAADISRFPEGTYGDFHGADGSATNDATNDARYAAILAAFSAYGAAQDDPTHQYSAQTNYWSTVTGWNDVRHNIYAPHGPAYEAGDITTFIGSGNFELFMTMLDPLGTSQGRWRVGDQGDAAHRFARQFNASNDAMRFQLEREFVRSTRGSITFNVTYYDSGTGSWKLVYDAKSDSNKTAISVTNGNTLAWVTVSATVDDYLFGQRGANSSDLGLEYVSGDNTIFHMIEIERTPTIHRRGEASEVSKCQRNSDLDNLTRK